MDVEQAREREEATTSREKIAQILIGNVRSNPDREQAYRDVVADLKAVYLAGVRAGLRAAVEVVDEQATLAKQSVGERWTPWENLRDRIAALDAEEVAG